MPEKLAECCKDMTVQEIADTLMASSHGVADPLMVAAYLKSKAG
jgi:hypothetical protein